jgi:iron complex outermembrane recepter protein
MAANSCTYPFEGNLVPQTENINLLASFDKRLDDDWKLDVKGSLFESTVHVNGLNNGYSFPTNGAYSGMLAGGPGVPLVGGVGVTDVTYNGMSAGGLIPGTPLASSTVKSKSYRLVADLNGSWGEWDIDTSVGYTRNQINVDYNALINYTALQSALNDPTTPFSFTGNNSASVLSSIFPSATQSDNSTLEFAEFHATRSLMTLPGGDLGIAIQSFAA